MILATVLMNGEGERYTLAAITALKQSAEHTHPDKEYEIVYSEHEAKTRIDAVAV